MTGMLPRIGLENSPTTITVYGTSFINSEYLRVKFGLMEIVNATYVSATAVRCVTPLLPVGHIAVEVSNNAADYSSNNVQFEYVLCPPGMFCPATDITPCPPGHMVRFRFCT